MVYRKALTIKKKHKKPNEESPCGGGVGMYR